MKSMRVFTVVSSLLLVAGFGLARVSAQQPQPRPQLKAPTVEVKSTIDNLMAAFEGESNAHAKYLAFAKKAEEEGYMPVASLFRAAARAEQIHANTHADLIKKLGGTPKAEIKPIDVKSTRENLQVAIEGESYERDVMYPAFMTKAKAERSVDAVKAFNFAMTAEGEHAKLYTQALTQLDSATWKSTEKKPFFVCKVCGYTVTKLDFEKCVSCFSPKEEYETIQ